MNNQELIQQALLIEKEAERNNLAEERYKIFLKSIEASENELKTSWEKFWQSEVAVESITSVYMALSSLLDMINFVTPFAKKLFDYLTVPGLIGKGARELFGFMSSQGDGSKFPIESFGGTFGGSFEGNSGKKESLNYNFPIDTSSPNNSDTTTSEYKSIVQAATDAYVKKVKLEKDFTLVQVEEAIKRAQSSGLAREDELKYLEQYRDEVIKANMDINGQFLQTSEASKQTMEGLSQAIWSQAQSANQVLYDMQGNVITSANGVYLNLTQSNASFSAFVKQLALDTGKTAAEIYGMFSQYAGAMSQFGKGEIPFSPTAPVVFKGGGGGGGSGETAQQKAAKERIKSLEKEKKALSERQKDYNDYLDSLREELKLQKEEQTFLDSLKAKNKSLAKLKSDIAILALDDSEEAKAKRLKLEEDAASLETEITKDTEDRKYDLQLNALDQLQQDFDDKIQRQTEALDKQIEKLNEVAQATSGGGGSVASAYDALAASANAAVQSIIDRLTGLENATMRQINVISGYINSWIQAGIEADVVYFKAQRAVDTMNGMSYLQSVNKYGMSLKEGYEYGIPMHHDGVDSGFVGGLKSNESFARLLKGELIVNEKQMNGFMSTTLPSLIKNGNGGGVSINMPLNISGNVNADTLPDIQKMMDKVVATLNNSLKNRGYIRNTNLVSI